MAINALPSPPRGFALALGWRRVRFVLILTFILGSIIGLGWHSGYWSVLVRVVAIGFVALLAFGFFEQLPAKLPRWLARWALQVTAVALSIPIATFAIYVLSTAANAPPFWESRDRLGGFGLLTALGMFLAPWLALAALVRQKEALAREQALALDLARSEAERHTLDARLSLLQAQVSPHFLFNTLANIQALVDSGSPRAPEVLRNLVAYLRAALPRLNDPATTLGQELQLVRAYLALMRMRMPDRLEFAVTADPSADALRCPPMTLLTLVENAVRHGIDPSESGGRVDIEVCRSGSACSIRVSDTGVGLLTSAAGPGTGLVALRERLRLFFGAQASLSVRACEPHGAIAEITMPAREEAA
ncbi:MAG: histidine kinase [Steroidobacteraceae bacterium]